tara:strand:- start:774 stop:998 length:225 start_codon:yes stop_codon:yes gene_type:complete
MKYKSSEWEHIKQSPYFRPTKSYSGTEWKALQLSIPKKPSTISVNNSKEWLSIIRSDVPAHNYVYECPPDELMF